MSTAISIGFFLAGLTWIIYQAVNATRQKPKLVPARINRRRSPR